MHGLSEPVSALSTLKFLFNGDGIMPVLSAAVAGTAAAQLGIQNGRARTLAMGVMSATATMPGAHAVASLAGAGGLAVDAT